MTEFLLGVLSGIIANQIYDWQKSLRKWKWPRYVCRLCGVDADEYIERELRTKTSPSDYGIELYNLSDSEIVIDYFDIYYRGTIIVGNCELPDEQQKVAPKHKLKYTLMEQDADALCWHCKQKHFSSCTVIFHFVSGKKIKRKLDVSAIVLQIELQEGAMAAIV